MILYTSPTCKYCPEIKLSLDRLGYNYEVRDVSKPQWREFLVDRMGIRGVPVLVDGTKTYIGKDEINLFLHIS